MGKVKEVSSNSSGCFCVIVLPGFSFLSACTLRPDLCRKTRRNCVAMIRCGRTEENTTWQWFARHLEGFQPNYRPSQLEEFSGIWPNETHRLKTS